MHRPHHLRRALAVVFSGVLMMGLAAMGAPAQAAPTFPEFIAVDQAPNQLVFDSDSEHLKLTQEMDDPASWTIEAAYAYICTGNSCNHPGDFSLNTNWLRFTGATQQAQSRFLSFEGDIPNPIRHFSYYFELVYDTDPGPGVSLSTYDSYQVYVYNGVAYYSFGDVYAYGDTKISIDGPDSIPAGSALSLHGTLQCFGNVGYKAPDYGWVDVQYRLPGEDNWTYAGGATSYNQATGDWKYTNIAGVGATADWRAVGAGDNCISGNSPAHTVTAGSGPPPTPNPPPASLPGAPSLSVGDVTANTAVLTWGPPSGDTAGITGYRFGWTSASGLPVPSWSNVYAHPEHPFTMTNLNPDSDYTMYVEAVTDKGAGDRATVQVHTDAAAPPPPPPPSVNKPGKPRSVHARAGNHKVLVTWKAGSDGGGNIDQYQVRRKGKLYGVDATHTRLTVKGLVNGKLYTFAVRAHNAVGWSAWSAGANARPHS